MKPFPTPHFSCSDLYLAAYLIAKGLRLVDVDKADSKRAVFVFSDVVGREDTVASFWSKEARIEPRAFIAAIKEAKERLYSD